MIINELSNKNFPVSAKFSEEPRLSGPGGLADDRDQVRAAREAGCPILDTSTPKSAQTVNVVGRLFNRRNRKMWARAISGMRLPGRYYFLTLTTTPDSPPLESVWNGLRQWLKRHRPGMCWLYCFTVEGKGQGVIHMVIRLRHRQKNIDVDELRAWWKDKTGASQIKIKRVPESKKDNLASYLVNQKIKVGMACEMGYQSAVSRWRWSKGWLPRGYTKMASKTWAILLDAPGEMRLKAVNDLLHGMYEQERKHG